MYECGPNRGSALIADKLEKWLPPLLEKYDVRMICDLGCGDLYWFSRIMFDGIYRGYDEVVRASAWQRMKDSGQKGWALIQADILVDAFEPCDLAIVKDVFIHYSDKECLGLLQRIKERAHYLCAESHTEHNWPRSTRHVSVPDGKRYGCAANATNLYKVLGEPIEDVVILPSTPFGPKRMAIWDMESVQLP